MNSIFQFIYALPRSMIIAWIIVLIGAWGLIAGYFEDHKKEKLWIWINRILLILFILVVLRFTLFSRETGDRSVSWGLFGKLRAAKRQPEYYIEMLMNLFLFVPFGVFAPFALKKPGRDKKTAKRILIVILIGFLLSVLIELLQMALSIGLPEAEDVLFNTIGTAIGTGAFVVWILNRKIRSLFSSL